MPILSRLAKTGIPTRVFRAMAERRCAARLHEDVVAAQREVLLGLVTRARNTTFGSHHRFAEISSVADYQQRVPVRTYEQFWQEYLQPNFPQITNVLWPEPTRYFGVSSGTTSGKTKFLPITDALLRSNQRAALDVLAAHAVANPSTKLFSGKSFVLGGSTALKEEAPGVQSGDLSGIVAATIPLWAAPFYFPPPELALLEQWEEKIDVLARRAVSERIVMISGVPSWLIILFEAIAKQQGCAPEEVGRFFPHLSLLLHGGVAFGPYRERFQALLSHTKAELREVYPASEGFIAVQDSTPGAGLRLNTSHGVFFEFIPVEELNSANPTRHWVDNIEPHVQYAVVLTTCAGLWSYVLGDTVRFESTRPPRLVVTGRTSYMLSAFGEHLIGEEIESAVTEAAHVQGVTVTDFTVGALFPKRTGELGGHLYVVELAGLNLALGPTATGLSEVIDATLQEKNDDYRAHRAEGFGMRAPRVELVAPGTFAGWMKARGKLGGQHKVPRVIQDPQLLLSLINFCDLPIDDTASLSAHL